MTKKIPVGETISRAYGFAFGNIISNLGAIWIPALVLFACSYLLSRPYAMRLIPGDPDALRQAMPFFLLGLPLALVLTTSQIAALTKEALGLRTGNPFLQFPFGAPTWRLLAAYLLFMLAMIVIYVVGVIVALIGGIVLGILTNAFPADSGKMIVATIAVFSAFVFLCAITYIATRLSFLLAPVCIAEQRITLVRGWELARGNFWRIFLVLLAVLIPLFTVECVYIYVLYGDSFFPPLSSFSDPQAMAQFQQHQQQVTIAASERLQHYWYFTYSIGLLFVLLIYGLFAGLSAFAYKALAEDTPAEGNA